VCTDGNVGDDNERSSQNPIFSRNIATNPRHTFISGPPHVDDTVTGDRDRPDRVTRRVLLATAGLTASTGCLGPDSTDTHTVPSATEPPGGPETTGVEADTAETDTEASDTDATETAAEGATGRDLVFRAGTEATIPLPDGADSTRWVLEDHAGDRVAAGSIDDGGSLSLPIEETGYFEVAFLDAEETEQDRAALGIVPAEPAPADRYFGQSTHYGLQWPVDSMALLREAGVSLARDSIRWQGGKFAGVEPERGTIKFTDGMDAIVEGFGSVDVEPILLLNYNHTAYIDDDVEASVEKWPNTIFPHTQEQRDAFVEYALAVLEQYPDVSIVEVWNEPNSENFSRGPAGNDPEAYRQLLKQTYRAIEEAHPDVTVLSGGTSGTVVEWHETVLAEGGIDHMDGVAFHPYNAAGARPDFQDWKGSGTIGELNDAIRAHNDGDLLPVWITEMGWPTTEGRSSEPEQARKIVRSNVYGRTYENLQSYCYYNFINDTPEDTRFGSFGLLRHPEESLANPGGYAPKPSYVAYSVMTRQLGGASYVGTDDGSAESIAFEQSGETVRVLWAEGERDVTLAVEGDVTVVSLYGQRESRSSTDGEVTVSVGPDPIYVRGSTTGLR
jgi:hypothetical protein